MAAAGSAWAAVGTGTPVLSTSAIASNLDPGLADITSTLGDQQAISAGTGMVLTSTGEVLTNNHVIAGATSIQVRDIGNGRSYTAKVVGYTESNDVAVLQLQGASGLQTADLGNSAKAATGQKVVALGNAGGKGGTPSVVTGKITALGSSITAVDDGDGVAEHLTGLIRTNADIQPGDSGGALADTAGQVIGMDTAASTAAQTGPQEASSTTSVPTTAFSIPINTALSIASQIEAGSSSATVHIGGTGFLGVAVASSEGPDGGFGGQSTAGAVIEQVLPGSAAAQAGLASGDTIVSVGGHDISTSSAMQTAIEGYHPGDSVSVTWTDQFGQANTATVVLTTGPAG
jgi:S1-C subfamily serine protease